MNEVGKWVRLIGLTRIICLLLMLTGVVMMYSSPTLTEAGGILLLAAGFVFLLASRRRTQAVPAAPISTNVRVHLIALAFVCVGVFVSLLFPSDSRLGIVIGGLVAGGGVAFAIWFVIFRRRRDG